MLKELENLIIKINAMTTKTINEIEVLRQHHMISKSVDFGFDEKKGKITFQVKRYKLTDAQLRETLARISQAKKSANALSNLFEEFYNKISYMDEYMQQYYCKMMYSTIKTNLMRNKDEIREQIYKDTNRELPVDFNVFQLEDNFKTKKTSLCLLTQIKDYTFNKFQEINSKQM